MRSGDATHSEPVQNMKIHVAYAAYLAVSSQDIADALETSEGDTKQRNVSKLQASYIYCQIDSQPAYHGSGEELCNPDDQGAWFHGHAVVAASD